MLIVYYIECREDNVDELPAAFLPSLEIEMPVSLLFNSHLFQDFRQVKISSPVKFLNAAEQPQFAILITY